MRTQIQGTKEEPAKTVNKEFHLTRNGKALASGAKITHFQYAPNQGYVAREGNTEQAGQGIIKTKTAQSQVSSDSWEAFLTACNNLNPADLGEANAYLNKLIEKAAPRKNGPSDDKKYMPSYKGGPGNGLNFR